MKIKLWGTRGSIPTPSTGSFQTSRYGGDTTCISVETADQFIIIDGGTGLRLLGLDLIQKPPIHATFLFTHTHWDHIQGFPFFTPAFTKGFSFDLYGADQVLLKKALSGQQEAEKFPVSLRQMAADLHFHSIDPSGQILSGRSQTVITSAPLNHPGGCLGYRIEERLPHQSPSIFAVATDTEHFPSPNPQLQKLAQNADVLLYDAQYTLDEYSQSKVGWGHSTWYHGLIEAQFANVKSLLLTHHDPLHDDNFISVIESQAAEKALPLGIQVRAATQLLEISI